MTFLQALDQTPRRGGSTDQDRVEAGEVISPRVLVQELQHAQPDGRHAGGDCGLFALENLHTYPAVTSRLAPNFASVVIQILLLDIVFSLDSVITAVGMARQLGVMVAAVIIALVFMLIFSGRISGFIQKHPTLKMLALSFLLLIGCALVAEGFHKEIPKGYIYFAMAFSVGVESLNIRLRAKQPAPKVALHQPYR